MYIRRLFNRQLSLRNRVGGGAFLCFIVMLCGCGGEETVNSPVSDSAGDGTREEISPISTRYYPMTVGNRWVYRNSDGFEWAREVTNKEISSHLTYNLVGYDPPIEDSRPGFLKTPAYATTRYRLALLVRRDEMHDAVWQTIRQSGGKHANWNLRHTFDGSAWQTHKNEAALVYLFHYHTRVVSHQEPTPLRFPACSGSDIQSPEYEIERGQ